MRIIRTPEERFSNLADYSYKPNYVNVDDGEGGQLRIHYVDDVIEAFDLLVSDSNCHNQIFNVGNQRETSIKGLAEIIKRASNCDSKIKYIPHSQYYGEGYEDMDRRVPDISKLKEYTNWEPKTSLEEGIAKTLEYTNG